MMKMSLQNINRRKESLPLEIIILMVFWVLAGQFAPATVDSIRDIYQANAIASGNGFPLVGPQLAHTVHLGPLWFYILSIPAAIFGSWGGIALLVFFLSATKFWLAFILGKQLHSAQLGLLLALFLALPGWSSTQLVIWTHTSVLEASLLLYLLTLRHSYIKPSSLNWTLTGFCFALALHAHPTALPFIMLLPLAWESLKLKWHWVLLFLLGVTIPFLPYGIDQLMNGFSDLDALQRYQSKEFDPGGPLTMFKMLYSVVVIGPNLYYKTVLPGYLAACAMALHWTLVTVVVALGLRGLKTAESGLKRLLLCVLVTLILVVVAVVLIRARSPWHMAYAPSFAVALCYAVLATLAFKPRHWPGVRPFLAAVILLLFITTITGTAYRLYNNNIRFQSRVMFDVKNLESSWGRTSLEIPAFQAKAHGDFLCQQGPLVLHGPYAAMVEAHVGLEVEMSCQGKHNILVGGETNQPGFKHLVGVTSEMSRALKSRPEKSLGNVDFYSPLAISGAGRAVTLAEGDQNPRRQPAVSGNPEIKTLMLEADEPSALLISRPIGSLLSLHIERVQCNDTPALLLIRSNYSWLYRCGELGWNGSTRWEAWYTSSGDDLIDAVLLPESDN